MKTYREKLRDPRWQKKRLQILERDQWECRMCGDKDLTLHVHHKRYIWGREPWDVPDDTLITLCEGCHENESLAKDALADLKAVVAERFSADEIHALVEMIMSNCPVEHWGWESVGEFSVDRILGPRLAKHFWCLSGATKALQ